MRVNKLSARTEPLIKISLTIAEAQTLWHIANAAEGRPLIGYRNNLIPNAESIPTFKRQLYSLLSPIVRGDG